MNAALFFGAHRRDLRSRPVTLAGAFVTFASSWWETVMSIFGLVVHLIATRRREFAVRLALGASHADLARRTLRACLTPVAAGAGFGVIPAALRSD